MANDRQKVVLITGCSSGIGLKLATHLANDTTKQFYVIATMRNLNRKGQLEAAAGETLNKTLHIRQLDVCSDESVAECLNSIQDKGVDILGVIFNDVYAASKFAMEGFCESLVVQLLKFNIYVSMIEPGPVNTEFEMKLMEEVSHSTFPGTDSETVQYFKDIYLPASNDIFATMGQTPDTIAKATVKVIKMERPVFRYQTNMLYTPLTAMKYADNTGNLSIRMFYNLLFNYGTFFKISLNCLRIITCNCFRSSAVSPN
ncbi:retinol dehydrogenase 8-like isoform X2 [Stegostoma tigrinum]|uniref:retinol dehydrogenase 8-like isoform X2 n=1 Tax=Stegostoma tigrinum TaxID=3053191 RepID=UPI002870AAB8|nr:retinol dehydrogenase 8-like isoform X2 [Stegostoma tigrinum]